MLLKCPYEYDTSVYLLFLLSFICNTHATIGTFSRDLKSAGPTVLDCNWTVKDPEQVRKSPERECDTEH
jgi:hypothetical protein